MMIFYLVFDIPEPPFFYGNYLFFGWTNKTKGSKKYLKEGCADEHIQQRNEV